MNVNGIFSGIADALFTRRCVGCGEPIRFGSGDFACPECAKDFVPADGRLFYVDGLEFLKACYLYDGAVKKALRRFKFYNDGYTGKFFAGKIAEMLRAEKLLPESFVLVPVPGCVDGTDREYVQAEFLAKRTAKILGAECFCDIVSKKRSVKSQTRCRTAAERRKNVKGAFRLDTVRADVLRGKNVIIIDDISTTGATMTELSDVLRQAGAEKVCGACAARTPYPCDRKRNKFILRPETEKEHTIV